MDTRTASLDLINKNIYRKGKVLIMKENKKKKMPLLLKIFLILLGAIAALILAAFIWLQVNRDKIVDSMLTSASQFEDHMGEDLPNFEVETPDGTKITPDSLLEGKELTAIVLYASWCGPCEKEFPEMDAVYQKYQDKMSMVAIDVDALDTMDDVVKYGKDHNLSFPLAWGAENESLGFVTTSTYPTTLIVDRNGKICFWRVGSIPNSETFEQIVTTFMGDDYTEKHPGYYTFYSIAGPGVEFTVTTKDGTETYTIGEDGSYSLFTEDREEMTIKVTSVPEGYTVTDGGEIKGNMTSGIIKLPIAKA